MSHLPRHSLRRAARLAALLLAVLPAAAAADDAATSETPAEVKVERVKPMRDKYPTLRFLRENRDFIRARFDRLREKPIEKSGAAEAVDARFLAYARMLAQLQSGRDSLALAEDTRSRRALFESVTQLGELESQLDRMEHELELQRGRLAVLDRDFTGDQKTELLVVLTGFPAGVPLSAVAIELEDGGVLNLPLSDSQRESLAHGGMVEVFHGFVEPRSQVVRVGVAGERWPSGDSGYLQLEPARDRLNLLRLDLTGLSLEQGAPGIRASTWVHSGPTLSIDG